MSTFILLPHLDPFPPCWETEAFKEAQYPQVNISSEGYNLVCAGREGWRGGRRGAWRRPSRAEAATLPSLCPVLPCSFSWTNGALAHLENFCKCMLYPRVQDEPCLAYASTLAGVPLIFRKLETDVSAPRSTALLHLCSEVTERLSPAG